MMKNENNKSTQIRKDKKMTEKITKTKVEIRTSVINNYSLFEIWVQDYAGLPMYKVDKATSSFDLARRRARNYSDKIYYQNQLLT